MTQHDYNAANADGASFRADLNVLFQAIAENNSGASDPAASGESNFPFQLWADTSTGLMKIRNAANSDWIVMFVLATANMIQGADIDSSDGGAALVVLADGNFNDVTGTTTITSINALGIGTIKWLQFDGVVTVTHNATNLILPNGNDIVTVAGQVLAFYEYASGDWRLISNSKVSGKIDVIDVTITGSAASTPDANTLTKDHMVGARCTLNGTGTPAYIEEINFTGAITDNGSGDYSLTIDRDMANANYVVLVNGQSGTAKFFQSSSTTVGAVNVLTFDNAGTAGDVAHISVLLIGAQ